MNFTGGTPVTTPGSPHRFTYPPALRCVGLSSHRISASLPGAHGLYGSDNGENALKFASDGLYGRVRRRKFSE